MREHRDAAALLAEIDALGLAPGSWVATDADGTLWAADVGDEAWRRALERGLLRPEAAPALAETLGLPEGDPARDPHALARAIYERYFQGLLGEGPIVAAMTRCYSGWSEAALRAFGAELAAERIVGRAYASTGPLLEALLGRGLRVAVVTGSPRVLVEEALRLLGLPLGSPGQGAASFLVLGTDLEARDGTYTDRMREPITWDEGKVRAVEQATGGPPAVALGDTLGDLHLLESARALRVLVHPRPGLLARFADRDGGWCSLRCPTTVDGGAVSTPGTDRVIA